MEIKKEIKILREQAASDTRTGYPDLAAYRNQMADFVNFLNSLEHLSIDNTVGPKSLSETELIEDFEINYVDKFLKT